MFGVHRKILCAKGNERFLGLHVSPKVFTSVDVSVFGEPAV